MLRAVLKVSNLDEDGLLVPGEGGRRRDNVLQERGTSRDGQQHQALLKFRVRMKIANLNI